LKTNLIYGFKPNFLITQFHSPDEIYSEPFLSNLTTKLSSLQENLRSHPLSSFSLHLQVFLSILFLEFSFRTHQDHPLEFSINLRSTHYLNKNPSSRDTTDLVSPFFRVLSTIFPLFKTIINKPFSRI